MVAEMGKFVDNSWHAVKVAFANEIGRIAIARGIDPQAVAEIFLADTKLNVSPYYLRPGGPYGGSCLPKDLSGMLALARDSGLAVPVLAGARDSNGLHLSWLAQAVRAKLPPPGPILLLGLSFKAGTDDLRNSPLLDLAEILVEAGYDLAIYDPDVDPARLVGVNFAVAAEHQATLMDRMTHDLEGAAAAGQADRPGQADPGRARAAAGGRAGARRAAPAGRGLSTATLERPSPRGNRSRSTAITACRGRCGSSRRRAGWRSCSSTAARRCR